MFCDTLCHFNDFYLERSTEHEGDNYVLVINGYCLVKVLTQKRISTKSDIFNEPN